ncbi:flagellar basal body rod protein FlgC [Desulfobotulus sp.]|jgi:flagellar basal-body rod protein FlgC|uniref:flagellar basal body rod protein FlgC n=1 Tax=Desulfobotulus sp. TaxID=1940337 RepID=UPI002A363C9D|nr:flagellar basal body rod protein FlgC [Desulfobotulus sp.]MDY0163377.1 flagellar basal body rod protein FlgC [Desulfobotulus sp.]
MVDLLKSFKISGTALAAHRMKMNVIAQNLANVDTTRTEEGGPYRRKMVVYEARTPEEIPLGLQKAEAREKYDDLGFHEMFERERERDGDQRGVKVTDVVQSQEDFRLVYNPSHPDADPVTGYVAMPNVDHLTEMADMLVARRAYEASITAMNNTKAMMMKALEIGK